MASEILSNLQLGSLILNGSKINTVSATTGALISAPAVTVTDSTTAASGTLTQFNAHYLAVPTLAAANTGVTTTTANTLTIAGAPAAGTNETLTTSYALNVLGGATNLTGAATVGGVLTAPIIMGPATTGPKINGSYVGGTSLATRLTSASSQTAVAYNATGIVPLVASNSAYTITNGKITFPVVGSYQCNFSYYFINNSNTTYGGNDYMVCGLYDGTTTWGQVETIPTGVSSGYTNAQTFSCEITVTSSTNGQVYLQFSNQTRATQISLNVNLAMGSIRYCGA